MAVTSVGASVSVNFIIGHRRPTDVDVDGSFDLHSDLHVTE
jgi:hypothetical protein